MQKHQQKKAGVFARYAKGQTETLYKYISITARKIRMQPSATLPKAI